MNVPVELVLVTCKIVLL